MTTKPHKNPENGYRIRVGKTLPKQAANLAYIHTPEAAPANNLLIQDYGRAATQTSDTRLSLEREAFPKEDGYLQTETGELVFERKDVLLTDEYTLDENAHPLFYRFRSKKLFDARNSFVSIAVNGRNASQKERYENLSDDENAVLYYHGDKIKVSRANGAALSENEHYKIKLTEEGDLPYLYRIEIFTDFVSSEFGYALHYPGHQDGKNAAQSDILNAKPFFKEVEVFSDGDLKEYIVDGNESSGYRIQLSPEASQPLVLTPKERPPYRFQYQLIGDVTVRFSDKNKGLFSVGFLYVNDGVFGAIPLTTAMKRLAQGNSFLPEYVSLTNPHHLSGFSDPTDSTYWLADLMMPKEQYLDYDLLILSGYGNKDLRKASGAIQHYLANGGTLWVDNAGEGESALNFVFEGVNTFPVGINFSNESGDNSPKRWKTLTGLKDRYFPIPDVSDIGSQSANILFNGKESLEDWTVHIEHESAAPALMSRKIDGRGKLFVSNFGFMKEALFNRTTALRLFSNLLLESMESRTFVSPMQKETVYHRDDLFWSEFSATPKTGFYFEDKSDLDDTQLVAKKQLARQTKDLILPYLPNTYRNPLQIQVRAELDSETDIPVINASFEENSVVGESTWSQTKIDALPGFDFVRFAGTAVTGAHTSARFKSGKKSISIQATNSHGFFEQDLGYLSAGQYEVSVFCSSETATSGGIGFYDAEGLLLSKSIDQNGSHTWEEIKASIALEESTSVYLRIGFHEGAGSGTLWFDDLSVHSVSQIRVTPENDGAEHFYAYASRPIGLNLDIQQRLSGGEEFLPVRNPFQGRLAIKSFVYQWFAQEGRYRKEYGNHREYPFEVDPQEGTIVFGKLLELLPALRSGVEWAKKENVYYEVSILDSEWSDYLNVSLYDIQTQSYLYNTSEGWVLNHEDLWSNGYSSGVQVRVSASGSNYQATKRKLDVRLKEDNPIEVLAPGTIDERNKWFVRVRNGSFHKNGYTASDMETLKAAGRESFFESHLSGEHQYTLPEYERQAFYPERGKRTILSERAEYLDRKKIRVAQRPLVIEEESLTKERLQPVNPERTIYRAKHNWWSKQAPVSVYWDEEQNGEGMLLVNGFTLDYEEGLVFFDTPRAAGGDVYLSYSQDNFRIIKRAYANEAVLFEALTSTDKHTFRSKHTNWLLSPTPILYAGSKQDSARLHPSSYVLDLESGSVFFPKEMRQQVYVSYSYAKETEIAYRDADYLTGEITLVDEISFRDELYVSYVAEEPYVTYKGYYDETLDAFLSLDLNPTTGHTVMVPEERDGVWQTKEIPSEKLLGKEIYLYLLPSRSVYYNRIVTQEHCLRHVFGETQWQKTQASRPEALLLATIQVREHTKASDTVVLDARRRGGGLKESLSEETILKRVGYTSAFWDIGAFDGLAYYGNGATVIRLPDYLLKENGGLFGESEIKQLTEKYLAAGVYPIFEYYPATAEPYLIQQFVDESLYGMEVLSLCYHVGYGNRHEPYMGYLDLYELDDAEAEAARYTKEQLIQMLDTAKTSVLEDSSYCFAKLVGNQAAIERSYILQANPRYIYAEMYKDAARTELLATVLTEIK